MSSIIIGQDVLQVFLPPLIFLEMSCFLVTPLGPSPGHHMQGRRSRVSFRLRGCPLHDLWQVMSSVSAPPPSVKQKRARVLWDFFISIYKALCDHQTGGNRESGLLSFPLKSQLLQRGVVQLCCLGRDNLPHFVWLVQAGLPARRQRRAQPGF